MNGYNPSKQQKETLYHRDFLGRCSTRENIRLFRQREFYASAGTGVKIMAWAKGYWLVSGWVFGKTVKFCSFGP